jgi:TolB protein
LALITPPPSLAQNRLAFSQAPVVQLRDASGDAVRRIGTAVTAAITEGSGSLFGTTTVATTTDGTATFSDLHIAGEVGQKTLVFSAPGLASAMAIVRLTPGVATQMAIHSGDDQGAAVGTTVAQPPAVVVTDADENPVGGAAVAFSVASGGGAISDGSQVSNSSGIATVGSWTLGLTAGMNTLRATAIGLDGPPVTFVANAVEALGQIAFMSTRDADPEIFVMNLDGSALTQLTFLNVAIDAAPSWSPDGTKIAFVSTRRGDFDVYTMNADGSGVSQLTTHPADDLAPLAWSPDGARIVFASERDGNSNLYVMNADGSGQTRLTDEPNWDSTPSWSPDGSRIAFASDRSGNVELYTMNADGSTVIKLTDHTAYDAQPQWSPDGLQIAFVSDRDGQWEIYVMNADGSGVNRLTNDPAIDALPAWSHDGAKIVWHGTRDGQGADIYAMDRDGTNKFNVTKHPAFDGQPSWRFSPQLSERMERD